MDKTCSDKITCCWKILFFVIMIECSDDIRMFYSSYTIGVRKHSLGLIDDDIIRFFYKNLEIYLWRLCQHFWLHISLRMYNRDLISGFESERFFFQNSTIDQNISTCNQTMKKITSIFVIVCKIDIDSLATWSFVDKSFCFVYRLSHESVNSEKLYCIYTQRSLYFKYKFL